MWVIASRILAGIGIGEVFNFFNSGKSGGVSPTNDAINGIMKLLILVIVAVGGFMFFQVYKKKGR